MAHEGSVASRQKNPFVYRVRTRRSESIALCMIANRRRDELARLCALCAYSAENGQSYR